MGQGKTSAAITMMNERPDRRYMFVTPYLAETQRIVSSCVKARFYEPKEDRSGSKINDLERLVRAGKNISTTHALFSRFTEETKRLIREQGYVLVLDEVMETVFTFRFSKEDIDSLLELKYVSVDEATGALRWMKDDYTKGLYSDFADKVRRGGVYLSGGLVTYWNLPIENFKVFDEIYVLTYMFKHQALRGYFELHGIDYEYIGVQQVGDRYEFCDTITVPQYARELRDKIRILEKGRVNKIGDCPGDLSATWYKREIVKESRGSKSGLTQIFRNLNNIRRHTWTINSDNFMWTCYNDSKEYVIKGETWLRKSFLPCNARATNEFADRDKLAYCVNYYLDPNIITPVSYTHLRGHET